MEFNQFSQYQEASGNKETLELLKYLGGLKGFNLIKKIIYPVSYFQFHFLSHLGRIWVLSIVREKYVYE